VALVGDCLTLGLYILVLPVEALAFGLHAFLKILLQLDQLATGFRVGFDQLSAGSDNLLCLALQGSLELVIVLTAAKQGRQKNCGNRVTQSGSVHGWISSG
jgi:hypothetical protein